MLWKIKEKLVLQVNSFGFTSSVTLTLDTKEPNAGQIWERSLALAPPFRGLTLTNAMPRPRAAGLFYDMSA
jgi:hypothetical protein